jgi:hypothetical protein
MTRVALGITQQSTGTSFTQHMKKMTAVRKAMSDMNQLRLLSLLIETILQGEDNAYTDLQYNSYDNI